ncbi:sterile alpha motif domain-containing protein 9-like [Dreissena polymorpha]|uniref:sterile alpha motif domain-containing protein 9-like n=1 Tax=Dreissena polymorpha TaxID=45954 RepID=UPI002263C278|nr:sterile alpha motif domain-containing protein 9-like [Dreissena polymorpha]
MEEKNNFHRLVELHFDCCILALREFLQWELSNNGFTIQSFLKQKDMLIWVKTAKLFKEQEAVLSNPNVTYDMLDITLATRLIIEKCRPQDASILKAVKDLRKSRNNIVHTTDAKIQGTAQFNEACNAIFTIAAVLSAKMKQTIKCKISAIQNKEIVKTCTNMEKIMLNGEYFMIKLVESSDVESESQDGRLTLMKFNMTKWIRQLSRMPNVNTFLKRLKDANVITEAHISDIEHEYSYGSQMEKLILIVQQSVESTTLYRFCKELRSMHAQLADLIENKNTDGKETDEYLRQVEQEFVLNFLRDKLIECPNCHISCEEIHIALEDELRGYLEFAVLKTHFLQIFSKSTFVEGDTSFRDVTWKSSPLSKQQSHKEGNETVNFVTMKLDEFASFVGNMMGAIKPELRDIFQTAICDEAITANTFEEMESSELKEVFTGYLGSIKYGKGIDHSLKKLQKDIKENKLRAGIKTNTRLQQLREFDRPSYTLVYSKGAIVKPQTGNLLVPVHEFRSLNVPSKHWIAKETLRFLAACMNARKNGTLHFGIRPGGDRCGTIVGIDIMNAKEVDEEISKCMKLCFYGEHLPFLMSCIRPIQVIAIEDSENVVYEIDVVPSSLYAFEEMIPLRYPPKGPQNEVTFVYDQNSLCEIVSIGRDTCMFTDVENVYKMRLQERIIIESKVNGFLIETSELRTTLMSNLTGKGSKYVTDEYIPIIVSGNMSDQVEIWNDISMASAFSSAKFVLDFDASPDLRKDVETDRSVFTVKTAENCLDKVQIENTSNPVWVYCNGNTEISQPRMKLKSWTKSRLAGVKSCLDTIRMFIPKGRARILFLLYGELTDQEPLFYIAREMLASTFQDECIILTQHADNCKELRNDVARQVGDNEIDRCILVGHDWKFLSDVVRSVFRPTSNVVCKLPSSSTAVVVEMTSKERTDLKLTDIDIVSGEECEIEAERMSDKELQENEQEHQKRFYKGSGTSWWNFYYNNQVGERNCYRRHLEDINKALRCNKGEQLLETHEIKHHPGAGGSTLGMHLIWHFSQFKRSPQKAFRCCVVKHISDKTIEQIERFRNFKDVEDAKPIILLVDNKSEDSVIFLKSKLHELAYKTGTPGKLFGLIILIGRCPISKGKSQLADDYILTHSLKGKEMLWFDKKYNELEDKSGIDVKTLIAFNVMRNSFDEKYIMELTANILKDVTDLEKEVLTTLALVSSYENDHPIPQSVFDNMMNEQQDIDNLIKLPFGIAHTRRELESLSLHITVWNMKVSPAMDLLITKRETDQNIGGISIISQPLARAIISSIMLQQNKPLEYIVNFVLDLVAQHAHEANPMSKLFVKIVCSLFKTRQVEEIDNRETRLKFSDLVLDLEKKETEHPRQTVLETMSRCFDITKDAMVGQQLARYNIFIKEFKEAENAIQRSLAIKPDNSYLLDTYGQIFKAHMENVLETREPIDNEKATHIIELAFSAIEKFKDGQKAAIKMEGDTNMSCFHMEVKTAITLLEQFHRFECCKERVQLCNYLQQKEDNINESPFFELLQMCQKLEHVRCGSAWQQHLEQSLRSLEEKNYQIKRFLYTVPHDDETLLLKLRERYERFYGGQVDKYQFTFGLGLKPLMNAMQAKEHKHREALEKRVNEAKHNLSGNVLKQTTDIRDLLVYVGHSIITLCNRSSKSKRSTCDTREYITLLNYSTKLLTLQREKQLPRKYLEAYLYFAMLHWPLLRRTQIDSECLVSGSVYEEVMKEWDTEYDKNHFIHTTEQSRLKKPKNYYALGKGPAGNDIVDLESIRKEWMDRKKTNGRTRPPVFKDYFWRESFVEDELQRLDGIVDGNGHLISHTADYSNNRQHTFKIKTYYPCDGLSNRPVTFVLGFTWKGPTAFDVRETESSPHIDNIPTSDSRSGVAEFDTAGKYSHDVCKLTASAAAPSAQELTISGRTETVSNSANEQNASGSVNRKKKKRKKNKK